MNRQVVAASAGRMRRPGTAAGIGRVQLARETGGVKRVINLIKVGDDM